VTDLGFDALAARLLGRKARRESAVPPASGDEREAAILAMAAAVRRNRRQRFVIAGSVAAVASIAVAVTAGGWLRARTTPHPATAGPSLARSAAPAAPAAPTRRDDNRIWLHDGAEVSAGQRFVAQGSQRVLLSSTAGSELALEQGTELRVLDTGPKQRFRLARGQVHAEVAPLRADERFVIETSDAEVEVHGTAFDVTVAPVDAHCRAGIVTRVAVAHGVVEVRSAGRDERVAAGEQWPPECAVAEAAAQPATRATAVGSRVSRRARHADAARAAVTQSAEALRRSTLEAENDAFAAALASEKSGEPQQALVELDDLLQRWPSSPLAETAMAERIRLLVAGGEARAAARAAREYLRRFPNGAARDEAQRVAGGP